MAIVTKTGFGPWKKTVVEHAGSEDTFSGGAKVTQENGVTCVEEGETINCIFKKRVHFRYYLWRDLCRHTKYNY